MALAAAVLLASQLHVCALPADLLSEPATAVGLGQRVLPLGPQAGAGAASLAGSIFVHRVRRRGVAATRARLHGATLARVAKARQRRPDR